MPPPFAVRLAPRDALTCHSFVPLAVPRVLPCWSLLPQAMPRVPTCHSISPLLYPPRATCNSPPPLATPHALPSQPHLFKLATVPTDQQGASRPESLSDAHPLRVQMPPQPSSTVSLNAPSQTNKSRICFFAQARVGPAHLGRRDHIFAKCRGLKTRGWPNQCQKDKQGWLIAADSLPICCQLADPEGEFVRNPPRVTTELKHTIMQRRPEPLMPYHRCTCAPELSYLRLGLLVKCPLPQQGLTDGFSLRIPYFFLDLFPLPIISPLDPYLMRISDVQPTYATAKFGLTLARGMHGMVADAAANVFCGNGIAPLPLFKGVDDHTLFRNLEDVSHTMEDCEFALEFAYADADALSAHLDIRWETSKSMPSESELGPRIAGTAPTRLPGYPFRAGSGRWELGSVAIGRAPVVHDAVA
ncbi:hypothetical protein EDB86DRAFT_2841065 [Lactarius hatsudake]|nr:hypothetical protein EDB86DRAFT_2841065 [Lactarius hatsudake]